MAIIPKKLAFKLCFRKKTKTRKLIHRERKLRKLSKNINDIFLSPLDYTTTSKSLDLAPINWDCPKQRSNIWPINSDHVYLKTQINCSVSSKRLLFGLYGICVVQHATISAAYVETIKLDIAKILKKKGRVWTRICCDCPVSARPAETRMGKGKGSISYWVAKVRPGQLLFEFSGVTTAQLDEIFQKLCKKTSIGLSIIS